MNFNTKIDKYRELVNIELNNIYKDGPNIIREPINHILRGGKRFRPILCMLTSSCFNGDKNSSIIIGTAIELLHNFSLIHDDIMDDDNVRHGYETIHSKWNKPIAILSGDAVLALALLKLNNLEKYKMEIIKEFNKTLIKICEGQALDIEFEKKRSISMKEYINMIDKKTGYMIGFCALSGSIISNLSVESQMLLKEYGKLLGRAFQIQDDLLEVISCEDKMGKSLESDFVLNKKTFLSVKGRIFDSRYIDKCIQKSKEDFKTGYSLYKEFLINHNIIDETKITIKKILLESNKLLDKLNMENNTLYKYTELILNRRY